MINAGSQLHNIQITQAVTTTDPAAGAIVEPVVYWATRAKIKQLSSIKTVQAQQEKLIGGYTFAIRYRNDKTITDDMYIVWGGKRYVINSIENVGMANRELLITALNG